MKLKAMLITIFVLLLAIISFGFWATGLYYPKSIQSEKIYNGNSSIPVIESSKPVKILSWNVQFMAGNHNNHFFFDMGHDPFPPLDTLKKTILEVARVIKNENPDIILLQELDISSARTYYQNQIQELLSKLPKDYQSYTCTYYSNVNFLPVKEMLGPFRIQICIVSKYRIQQAVRYALPSKISTNFFSQQFHFKRAILSAVFRMSNGNNLSVLNTHFSAFAVKTDTPTMQGEYAYHLLSRLEMTGPAVLGGDFNAQASEKFYKYNHPSEYYLHSKTFTPIFLLVENFKMFPTIAELSGKNRHRWLTYMPSADRTRKLYTTIDFIFLTKQLTFENCNVLQKGTLHISDHVPIVCEIQYSQLED